MKLRLAFSRCRQQAFTMVEIALSLAIIAFALVAIIGVLPSGMTVQRDNRWNSVINDDGQFWLNAIRQGARDMPVLVDHVQSLSVNGTELWSRQSGTPITGEEIIGLLSQPLTTNRVRVRAFSSSASEQGSGAEVGLEYILFSMITPYSAGGPLLATNLHEVRLVFRWPAYPNNSFGVQKKVFRTLVRGHLALTNNGVRDLYFFNNQLLTP